MICGKVVVVLLSCSRGDFGFFEVRNFLFKIYLNIFFFILVFYLNFFCNI